MFSLPFVITEIQEYKFEKKLINYIGESLKVRSKF